MSSTPVGIPEVVMAIYYGTYLQVCSHLYVLLETDLLSAGANQIVMTTAR